MKHSYISVCIFIKVFKSALVFINHFCHTLSCICFIHFNSLIIKLGFFSQNVFFLFLHLLCHSHFVCHKMSINFWLLHQILKTLFLKQSFFFLLLSLFHLFIKLFFFTFNISQFFVTFLPKTKHFFCKFLSSYVAFFSKSLRVNCFFTDLFQSIRCKLFCISLKVLFVFLVNSKSFWDVLLSNIDPSSSQNSLFLFLSKLGRYLLDS